MCAGVADLRDVFERARGVCLAVIGTLLFVDEIHRVKLAEQDGFLPYVDDGTVILVGATTENPSFELNPALLSRCQVMVLKRLEEPALRELLARAEARCFYRGEPWRSEEHTSELQSLMRISYAVFC